MQVKIGKALIREQLAAMDKFKSLGTVGFYPMILKEPEDMVSESLNEIFDSSWSLGKLPEDQKRTDMVPIF